MRLTLPTSLLALVASVSALDADGGLRPRDIDALPTSEPTLKAWYGDETLPGDAVVDLVVRSLAGRTEP